MAAAHWTSNRVPQRCVVCGEDFDAYSGNISRATGGYVCKKLGCVKERRYWARIYRDYGLMRRAYDGLVTMQNGRCAICGTSIVDTTPHIDHCHDTGRVRGLLCATCNRGIGMFSEDIGVLRNAAKYLEKMTG